MSICNLTTPINGTDCIGDSRAIINQNFLNLDNVVCALSSTGVGVSNTSTITMTFNSATRNVSSSLNPSSVTVNELANNAVETAKIKDSNVTTSTLAFDGGSLSYRNKIINGAFEIWQRGTSFTSSNYFTADRFLVTRGGSGIGTGSTNLTVTRDTTTPSQFPVDPDNFNTCMKIQRVAGDTNTQTVKLLYVLETKDCLAFSGKSATLSFFIKRGTNFTSTDLASYIHTGTSDNQGITSLHNNSWSGINTQMSSVIPVSFNWQRITQTVSIANNIKEIGITIQYTPQAGSAGADETLYITGVQFELGATVTPFEYRLLGHEIDLCQRYFEKSYDLDQTPSLAATAQAVHYMLPASSNTLYGSSGNFLTRKFKVPQITIFNPTGASPSSSKFIDTGGSIYPVTGTQSTETRISTITTSVNIASGKILQYHYIADAEII